MRLIASFFLVCHLGNHPSDGLGHQAFVTLGFLVLHLFAIFEGAKSFALDAAEMDKDILAFGVDDEPKTLFGIKPFDSAGQHGKSLSFANRLLPKACGAANLGVIELICDN
jgi:hypothetical protein